MGARKTADGCEQRKTRRILRNGKNAGPCGQRRQQDKGLRSRQERVDTQGRKKSQIQNADGSALQRQRVTRTGFTQRPAEHQKADRGKRHAGQTQLNRHPCMLCRVAQ